MVFGGSFREFETCGKAPAFCTRIYVYVFRLFYACDIYLLLLSSGLVDYMEKWKSGHVRGRA
jgi:hypothetical protein